MQSRSEIARVTGWNCASGGLAKSDSTAAESQDWHGVQYTEQLIRVAVADGATMSSGQATWAKILVKHALQGAPRDMLERTPARWLGEPRRQWHRTMLDASKAAASWFSQQAVARPAAATLLSIECRPTSEGIHVFAVACGDTCVLITRGAELLGSFPLTAPEQFNTTPHLLTSLGDQKAGWTHHEWKLPSDSVLLIATDAVAEHLLARPAALDEARGLRSNDEVRAFLRTLQDASEVVDDDLTLVVIGRDPHGTDGGPRVQHRRSSQHPAQQPNEKADPSPEEPSSNIARASPRATPRSAAPPPRTQPDPRAVSGEPEGARQAPVAELRRPPERGNSADWPIGSLPTESLPPGSLPQPINAPRPQERRPKDGFSRLQIVVICVVVAISVNMLLYVFAWPLLKESDRGEDLLQAVSAPSQASDSAAVRTGASVASASTDPPVAGAPTTATPTAAAPATTTTVTAAPATTAPATAAPATAAPATVAPATAAPGSNAIPAQLVPAADRGMGMICCANKQHCTIDWESREVRMKANGMQLRNLHTGARIRSLRKGDIISLSRPLDAPADVTRLHTISDLPSCGRWIEVFRIRLSK